jgi:hypothetical protein
MTSRRREKGVKKSAKDQREKREKSVVIWSGVGETQWDRSGRVT